MANRGSAEVKTKQEMGMIDLDSGSVGVVKTSQARKEQKGGTKCDQTRTRRAFEKVTVDLVFE